MSEQFINIFGVASLLAIISLAMVLAYKMDSLKKMQITVNKLKRSLDEMDEQAKLIVRTDMELNKTQEELDKKITGLYALQRLSRAMSTTLEENQVFKMLQLSHLEELGFEKAGAFLWEEDKKLFTQQINIGYLQEEMEAIKSDAGLNSFYLDVIKSEKTVSSISLQDKLPIKDKICRIFKTGSFVLSPILPKEGRKGFFFVGTQNPEALINEGDEEVIAILANQLGQVLENARLFEKTWREHQDLEKNVEERTRELNRVLNDVKIISKRKTDFVSAVSHELRTPLTSIKGYAAILLTGKLGKLPEEVGLRLDKINKHSDELVHMVNDLLDIARIESGRQIMKKESLNLKEIMGSTVDLLSPQAKEKEVELNFNLPDNAQEVFADSTEIKRVFINLVGNALKFTPAKGRITMRANKVEKEIWVDITDTGCGIPEEAQASIFEEFYRVDNPINDTVKGTGLGLSLVKHIIVAHGGKIWVKSKVGSGSTFTFTLPQS